jgi:hypothetical protein
VIGITTHQRPALKSATETVVRCAIDVRCGHSYQGLPFFLAMTDVPVSFERLRSSSWMIAFTDGQDAAAQKTGFSASFGSWQGIMGIRLRRNMRLNKQPRRLRL